ncbi:MAG: hypothetical protein HS132_00420 [Planctomycetia bacterium]|nr:hypothetical protein [Planctomycetia bacterium]
MGLQIISNGNDTRKYRQTLESFFCRQRYYENLEEGMNAIQKLIENAFKKLTPARVTDAFFGAERVYWERRKRAGQKQKAR